MRFSTLAATLASASLSSARIIGISAPSTIAPNASFPLTLLTENYIQTVADIAVAYGWSLPSTNFPTGYPYSVGSFSNSSYLGPSRSNTLKNVTVEAFADANLDSEAWFGKEVVLSTGVYSLYGASGSATVTGWNVTVKIGESTSTEEVRSTETGWSENGF